MTEEELREEIAEIVCISRWNKDETTLTAVFEMEEYIDIEDKLVDLINKLNQM